MGFALAGLSAAAPRLFDRFAVATIVLLCLGLNFRFPLALGNYYLIYATVLFWVGSRLFYPDSPNLNPDLLAYIGSFLAGYWLYRHRGGGPQGNGRRRTGVVFIHLATEGRRRIDALVWIAIGLETVRFVFLLRPYGVAGFYSGLGLVNRIQAYSQSGSTTEIIVNIALTSLTTAVAVLYYEACLELGGRLRYRRLFLMLVVLPALSLQREVLVLNGVLFAAIYVCDKRRALVVPARSKGGSRAIVLSGLVLVCAALAAVWIGNVRAKQLNQQAFAGSNQSTLQPVLRAEVTPLFFYAEVKANIGTLGYRHGYTIIAPLLTRLIPRGLWPTKPITSNEFYMRALHPTDLAAGYSLAPSIFGAGYLNFGMGGCAMLIALTGWGAAFFDRGYVDGLRSRIPQFLIVSAWSYSFLRDDLANSLASILLTFLVYRGLRNHFFARAGTSETRGNRPE
jgi:oligosaccharide repeat unit polymerase